MSTHKTINESKLDKIVADAAKAKRERESGYREKALGMYPWICGRCAREFTRTNLRRFFEVNRNWIAHAAVSALAGEGKLKRSDVTKPIKLYGIDVAKANPMTV